MSGLPSVDAATGLRARRWDALVLGSGTAALMAAARLGMAGQRVLVIQESAARDSFEGLREPFLLQGARDGGAVDGALRELSLALIDRRRMQPQDQSFQIVSNDLRVDVGETALCAEELVAWRLAKPEFAHAFTRALVEASEAERKAMLESPVVRAGRRRGRQPLEASHLRGLPAEVSEAPRELVAVLDAWVRALSNLGDAEPSPEAKARLLGAPLAGGALLEGGPPWLLGLLRRRVEGVYGEFRSIPGSFELVDLAGQPGVRAAGSDDCWLGRALVVAAPLGAMATAIDSERLPAFLRGPLPKRRRIALHWRTLTSVLPEGMGARVVLLGEPGEALGPVCLARFSPGDDDDRIDLIASAVVGSEDDLKEREAQIEARVRSLLPFGGDALVRRPLTRPRWDDDGWLEDPLRGSGWPGESELRVSSRPPVYRLDRAAVAGLGVEGDLLLGWRAGDAIAAELR